MLEQSILDSYPGSGNSTVPISAATWEMVTDAMAAVTEPGGTAGLARILRGSISPEKPAAPRP